MNSRQLLARRAIRAALETRRQARELKGDPICVYDIAERIGIEVKFCAGSSLGGMYAKASKTVLVPTYRPPGRQAFTCAHEIGHWYFGHGSRIDDLDSIDASHEAEPEEQLANMFAGYMLMTPWAVDEAVSSRGIHPASITAVEAYALASQFGVGYETLIQHLRFALNIIPAATALRLLKFTPKLIRRDILNDDRLRHMALVDRWWRRVAVDLQVGDVAVIENDITVEGASALKVGLCSKGSIVEAVTPGISFARGTASEWAVSIRVRRRDFEGRSIYRHLEDPDVDSPA